MYDFFCNSAESCQPLVAVHYGTLPQKNPHVEIKGKIESPEQHFKGDSISTHMIRNEKQNTIDMFKIYYQMKSQNIYTLKNDFKSALKSRLHDNEMKCLNTCVFWSIYSEFRE